MIRILFVVVASLVLLVGVAVEQVERRHIGWEEEESTPEVLSSEKQEVENEPDTDSDDVGVQSITATATNTPTPTILVRSAFDLTNFIYPNSQVSSRSDFALNLTSGDSTDAITQWYQGRINESGINVRSFVKTKTNDSVLNKLVGASGSDEIIVEISKEATSDTTKVLVSTINR